MPPPPFWASIIESRLNGNASAHNSAGGSNSSSVALSSATTSTISGVSDSVTQTNPSAATYTSNASSNATPSAAVTPASSNVSGPQSIETDGECLPKYRRDLVAKQKILRAELNVHQPQSGHCRFEVSRSEIFEVSHLE